MTYQVLIQYLPWVGNNLKSDVCVNRIAERNDLMKVIDGVLK